ncbi:major facilitator superfamily domain-containing protein 12 [Patella vulgata]|uniref:major facilitator superfamily domain-containing protein 12 n=1 Tax=Patella vulgata TaxID=6465 RepID=UPI0021802E52|nr:major facilitator superfamily domain-containing protein 12 [Patella vulgata]XP_050402519.1 major facilitator superfamily domain-containing protein 12 [Patella vulgata]
MALKKVQRFTYSVGHVLNDLCASMWFSYLLIFFHQVKLFNNGLAGNLMLIGQISDAVCTPFIGFESDRTSGILGLGKRKTWHLTGTLSVLISFPFLFNKCITCENSPDWAQFAYYAPFVVIFQFGWAATQISHLSLIPELTSDEGERVGLNSLRYAFTVLSNLAVYLIFWLLFELHDSGSSKLSIADAPKFQKLVFIVISIGAVFSFIFHVGVKEKKPVSLDERPPTTLSDSEAGSSIEESVISKVNRMYVTCWLKEPQFYQIGGIYMCTRLFVNVSQVYLPQYCVESLKLNKKIIAIIPLVVFSSGFVTSFVMRPLNRKIGRKATYFVGVIIGISACVWLYFINKSTADQVYGAAVLLGVGGSTMLVTSLAMTADLIAQNTESGAFVYGAMSFTDKLSNGIAIEIIQQFHPCVNCCPACVPYYRTVISTIPGSCAIVGLVFLLILLPQTIGKRRKDVVKLMKDVVATSNEITNERINTSGYDSDDENSPLLSKNKSINTPPIDQVERNAG